MRIRATFFFLCIFLNPALTARGPEVGIFGGTSSYIGDINRSLLFHNLSPSAGALIKYNFNDHYSLRTSFNFGRIGADDTEIENFLHQARGASFLNNFYELSLQAEFNFQPFRATIFTRPVSTYVTAGLAYTFTPSASNNTAGFLNLPFGAGIKYGLNRRVTLGMEWILKKTFTDNIDGVKSFGQFTSPSLVHNNDWVSLAGIFVTIKPFQRRGDCPVYRN
jgi:hypothetical protein